MSAAIEASMAGTSHPASSAGTASTFHVSRPNSSTVKPTVCSSERKLRMRADSEGGNVTVSGMRSGCVSASCASMRRS